MMLVARGVVQRRVVSLGFRFRPRGSLLSHSFHDCALLMKTSRLSHSLLMSQPQQTQEKQEQQMMKEEDFIGLTGGQIFHEMMLRHGVQVVFGYPGGAILPVYDAIYNSDYFDFVLPRHEQGAGHMAEGYARVTGKPGVVLVTSGPDLSVGKRISTMAEQILIWKSIDRPAVQVHIHRWEAFCEKTEISPWNGKITPTGATNMITPMQDALSDGLPMVVFSGQVPTSAIGTDAFQEADVVGLSRSCTKWNVMVKDTAELPKRINEAFEIATSGRPGPVLVDLPKDITAGVLTKPLPGGSSASIPGRSSSTTNSNTKKPTPPSASVMAAIQKTAKALNKASRPILYVGAGILASPEGPKLLKALSDNGNIPVTTTLQGMGAFDELDPKSLHMLGMHGSAYANLAMQTADVIVALGARFDDRVTGNLKKFAPGAKRAALSGKGGIFHFEIMPKNINKVVEVNVAVEGDVANNLKYLLPLIEHKPRTAWFEQLNEWKQKYPFRYNPSLPGAPLKPQAVIEELNRQLEGMKENVIITTGVGQHQMWAAQYFRWRYPRSFVTSGGLGTMGFGLPAAIGAKVAFPDKIVVDIDGDASFSMTGMELMTARQHNIGVKALILNNDFQGMVKQWQDLFYDKRYSGTTMKNPDFVKFAESMGCKGLRVRTMEELPSVMAEFLETKEPVMLDAVVCKEEHVFPMVPAGLGLHEMELGDVKLNEPRHRFSNSFMAP